MTLRDVLLTVADRILRPIEFVTKRPIWGCQMCGQCILHATGLACPMTCPKLLRNGPCGGVRPNGNCEVHANRPCVWVLAWRRSRYLPWAHEIHQIHPPVDWRLQGSSSWLNLLTGADGSRLPHPHYDPDAPAPMIPESGSRFERVMRSGRFAVTAELMPTDSADPTQFLEHAEIFRNVVDAINVTDNAGGHVHPSSLAGCALLLQRGFEPVYQANTRDRNRLGLQADLLGAAQLGVRNVFCISGDYVTLGDHPQARAVYDIDVIHAVQMCVDMRDRGQYMSGREIEIAPRLFVGAACSPMIEPRDFRAHRVAKKIAAGAQFIQTQTIFNVDEFAVYMDEVRALGLHKRAYFIPGVPALASVKAARSLQARFPGIVVPEAHVARLEKASREERRQIAIEAACESIARVRQIEGVAGVHIIPIGPLDMVPEICQRAGLLPRPA